MKRYFKTITAVVLAVLAVAACQKENLGEVAPDGREAEVKLTLTSPQIGTKSYADGKTVNKVFVHVYQQDADGNLKYIAPATAGESATPSQVVDMTGGAAKYSTRLVTGQKYTFVFWAECLGTATSPYTYDPETKTVTVSYTGVAGNDETRDAFCNVLKDVEITGAYSSDVKLYRPFAQLNFGVTSEDYAAAKAAGLEVTAAEVKLTNAATSLNLLDGTTTGDETVTFASAALPADPNATLTAGGKNYKYVAMDYVLVGKSAKTLSEVTLTLTATGTQSTTPKFTYSNVPLQANYRTNIVGNLFTSPAEVQIEVTPGFETPDNDVVVENVSSIAAANAAFANGATAVNVTNISGSEDTNIVLPKTTNGVSLTLPAVPAGKTVTIKYADGASEGQKPQTLIVNATSADAITIEAPTTHVELNGVTVNTVTASTSSTTLVVGKDVKITTLKIEQGAAEIYGNVSEVVKGEHAGTVTWYAGDATAFASAVLYADRIVIENDINRTSWTYISGGRVLTIDLNGHKISSPSMVFRICGAKVDFIGQGEIFETADDGFAPIVIEGSKEDVSDYTVVNIGKNITLRGWAGVLINPKEGLCYGVKVNCSAKIEKTESFKLDATGIYINGSIKATKGNVPLVNLDGCRINVKSAGIYAAGFAKWNLKNCDISAEDAAVEIRAGEMVIDGGNYEATADQLTVTPNGNGATVEGAAIGVSQHTTNLPTSVTIKKGTFSGAYSIWEKDVQDEIARDVITLSVENGTFNGSVYSQNNTSFIKGGTFSDAPAQDYLAEGYASTRTILSMSSDVKEYTVKKVTEVSDASSLIKAAEDGENYIRLMSNIEVDRTVIVGSNWSYVTLDLNGHKITNSKSIWNADKGDWSILSLRSKSGCLIVKGNGIIEAKEESNDSKDAYAIDVQNKSAKVLLVDGEFVGRTHSVYSFAGDVYIEGGKYSNTNEENHDYVINCYNDNYKNKAANIIVKGGEFANFNPGDCRAEGEHTSFLASGYKSEKDGDCYKAVKAE